MINQKYRSIFITLILVLVYIVGCKEEDQSRLQALWSANDPIVIPYNNRKHERNLGNLAPNPSFETGKLYYEKSTIKSFDVTGWKKIGEHIEWVDTTNKAYQSDEVFDGVYSVKIVRNSADETETTGEGILSDFIKVIPGNYSLKLFLRLENICPNQVRIGTKMFDAVNIRLQYFDKNKIEIKGVEFDAFNNKKIDNSFKSYTLSNYYNIHNFGWGEVFGKTASFPFFDGDIPDQARYVKIFIGLKGTGKMWIDNVDFRFTSQNFTLLERLKPFFDSSFTVYERLLPKPKNVVPKTAIEYYRPESEDLPVILVSEHSNDAVLAQIKRLKKIIGNAIKNSIGDFDEDKIKIVNSIDDSKNSSLIISIGDNFLHKKYANNLPDSVINSLEQSYYIQLVENENIVLVNARNNESIVNGILTLSQLFDFGKPVFYAANIIDYPDFLERAYLIQSYNYKTEDLKPILTKFADFKLNNLYLEDYGSSNNKYYPFKTIDEFKAKYQPASLSVMVDFMGDNQDLLNEQLHQLKIQNYKSILIAGEYQQEYVDYNPDNIVFSSRKDVQMELQYEHIDLLNKIDKFISDNKINTRIEFMAPWSNLQLINKGQGHADFYYRDLTRNIPGDIDYYWTGSSFCTGRIDYSEFNRMKEITGKSPILFDNSFKSNELRFKSEYAKEYYAGKLRVLSIFEPYKLQNYEEFYNQSANQKILLNIGELTELNAIRTLTAADYFWNTNEYNPDKSLWITLEYLYGRENAINLIYFNDAYYGLLEICKKIEINGAQHKTIRISRNFESELNKYYGLLNEKLNDKLLLSEIEQLKDELLSEYNRLMESVK